MDYIKCLIAFTMLGETGNSFVVINQTKKQMECLKLTTIGNENIIIPKKIFKKMLHDNQIELVSKLPNDVFSDIKTTWHNNVALQATI